jgi:hypothetical protein
MENEQMVAVTQEMRDELHGLIDLGQRIQDSDELTEAELFTVAYCEQSLREIDSLFDEREILVAEEYPTISQIARIFGIEKRLDGIVRELKQVIVDEALREYVD